MDYQLSHEGYMRTALELARAAMGQTGLNPIVGCVLVKEGRIVGLGSHLKRGTAHAEVHALRMAGAEAEGSTAYVTLEPCSHYGKTPPCADQLIEAGVKQVYVACEDPNPLVAGQGIQKLRDRGIEVHVGLLQNEAEQLNEKFFKFIRTGMPFVTLKTAMTLDGKVASKQGDSKWISNEEARQRVHVLRHQHQGIMVGAATVLADDPLLTARLESGAVQPTRIIVDSRLRIPLTAKVIQDRTAPTVILTSAAADAAAEERLAACGVKVYRCGTGPKVDLQEAMRKLAELEISSVLLEGGGTLNGAMLEAELIDKMVIFMAPKIIGGVSAPSIFQMEGKALMNEAYTLSSIHYEQIGDNICIIGYPHYGA
ncbi:bifunctional diaminohydroxyphosphoribosylaminopyrimidine deaminase/5-amino-6-(5-phosphoribosylamino)uracil reductase RibD [Marinicrinis lubricantis]|uniref:Riboflavin biosynthesis protein RibD n=1 Tax=Marinicrinis lubricantis TaxID=2086470 RepID=A0ABW1ISK5_9BACL